jgi:adhesin transport system outer membrane protein
MHSSRISTSCLIVALMPIGCWAQSLQEAVAIALTEYPSIASSKYKTEAAQSDVTRAKGGHWPQLSWSGTYSDYSSASLGSRWVQTPVLNLNLWSGGRIQADVDRAEALTQASRKQEAVTRDDVALLSSEAYLQWAHQHQMVALAEDNLNTHEKILRDFQTITQFDPGRRIDMNQAQVRYDNAKLGLLKSETDKAIAAERVSRMLMAPTPVEPSGLDFLPWVPYATLAQAQNGLNDQHPVIAKLLAQRQAAQATVRLAQAQHAPTVNLSHAKSTTPGLAEGKFVTQLQMNLPLVDGGTARGAVGTAQANLQALEFDLKETRLLLNEQLAASWADWQSASHRATMGEQQILTARELAQGYVQQFRVGRRSLLDLLNIQTDLYTYQSNAATALYESRVSQHRILATLGQLAKGYMAADPSQTAAPAAPTSSNTTSQNQATQSPPEPAVAHARSSTDALDLAVSSTVPRPFTFQD